MSNKQLAAAAVGVLALLAALVPEVGWGPAVFIYLPGLAALVSFVAAVPHNPRRQDGGPR